MKALRTYLLIIAALITFSPQSLFAGYDPTKGRFLSRDRIGERGGANLYGFVFNNPNYYYDFLGADPKPTGPGPTPVSGGTTSENGHNSSENNLFQQIADNAAGNHANAGSSSSGENLLNYLKDLTKGNCCIKDVVLAGHGWSGPSDGPGLPGDFDGNGFYEDGLNGDRWADQGSARIGDLRREIRNGAIRFCQPCSIKIHACNIASSFTESLGQVTGCSVTYAKGSCSPTNKGNKWHSGVGNENGYDGQDNGFWNTVGGAPSTPLGNIITP